MTPFGPYEGRLSPGFDTEVWRVWLAGFSEALAGGRLLGEPGRHRMVLVKGPRGHEEEVFAVKVFGVQRRWKDRVDRARGTKAFRSWRVARHLQDAGVGTPEPVGYVERWEGARLVEGCYISRFEEGVTNFRDELYRLYSEDPVCSKIMTLMGRVAVAIRAMHDAGVVHYDLGNQNILLRRAGEEDWRDVGFIDLNRARIREEVSAKERARDVSRIDLPSDFLRVFKVMYYLDAPPPGEFLRLEDRYRRAFARHTRTRGWRHPLREWRVRRAEAGRCGPPKGRDLWVWDDRSGQAIVVWERRERKKLFPWGNGWDVVLGALRFGMPAWRAYRRLDGQRYGREVRLGNRFGLLMEGSREEIEEELGWLERLGPVPVMLRFYHHEDRERWAQGVEVGRRLHEGGHRVSAALVQDRRAVLDPERWAKLVETVVAGLGDVLEFVEVGHAVNRVKWGIWSYREYRDLLGPVVAAAKTHPHLRWTGPAVIDFEYHVLLGLFWRLRGVMRFDAVSHHLYVDRRGAPENEQGGFDAEDKCGLARAIGEAAGGCEGGLIVSEVNWPLSGTGVYSPVNSPYETPGPRKHDPGVDEEAYANYMIRYLAMAVCSGMAERVYWWRLAAHGYGLIDDRTEGGWRARPAFWMFKAFLEFTRERTFVRRHRTDPRTYLLEFRDEEGEVAFMGWSADGAVPVPDVVGGGPGRDGFGKPVGMIRELGPRPVYFCR
ncbi:MAG TPA: lipopolysaccharide kinase InaA family protein [Kiritimatiellia bacterium]|nr:lipopolysaccharide kinase InaA family protein [Kiritimatiellia bacterium]